MRYILNMFPFAVITTGRSTKSNGNGNAKIGQGSVRMVFQLDSFKRATSADSLANALFVAN
jgi:hypothetical protein